jgi:hypothetical protein
MTILRVPRSAVLVRQCKLLALAACLVLAGTRLLAAQGSGNTAAPPTDNISTFTLDRVVAVVNNQAVLASDVEQQVELSIFEPRSTGRGTTSPQRALQQLISVALIQQQIREEDAQIADPTPQEIAARVMEVRTESPACAGQNCTTDTGWQAFLAVHHLTAERVNAYFHRRLQILRFIELRFRQGISISPEEIKAYYTDTLLPQYPPGQATPTLDQVAPRIREILLQQHVNVLFSDWLDNLRKEGQIEVLDPTLEAAEKDDRQGEPRE